MRAILVAWLAACSAGLGGLWAYKIQAGPAASAPPLWPAGLGLARAPGAPALVLLAHPRCPCTKASLEQLGWLLARASGRARATVVFVKPSGALPGWERSETWRAAQAIPGVAVVSDEGGWRARGFGARVSGQLLVYDADGRLAFSGGITSARGHLGDNAGRSAALAALRSERPESAKAPVFGCGLL